MFNRNGYVSLAESEWLGEPQQGDFAQGSGVSTSQLQNPNVSIESNKVSNAPAWQQSPGAWFLLIALLILCKVVAERAKPSEFSSVRVGLENWILVGLMAATFIYAGKITFYMIKFGPMTQFFGAL